MDGWHPEDRGSESAYSRLMDSQTPAATVIDAAPKGYVEYEIDIERVLRNDLPDVLDQVPVAPLTPASVLAVPAGAKGAYVLFENGHPVYAGKTDTRHGFRDRLTRHASTIQHRQALDPTTIGFKAIRILVFSNFDVEAILIDALRKADRTALLWNDSGFGSNDPGHNRETQEPADFDKDRPIDIDRPLTFLKPGVIGTFELLLALKSNLPYLFRYETDLDDGGKAKRHTIGHADHRDAKPIEIQEGPTTMREALKLALATLPKEWRATIFPDRVILYREKVHYKFAREYLEG